jgi:hypothetical protein
MKKRYFARQDEGVAGVIEALLMVALVAVVISTIQLVYIPQVMNQREADHMDVVSNQFSSMKAMIDLQSMTEKDVPISSPITLGSRELPYFVTARAFGELTVLNNVGEITVGGLHIATLTSIRYEAFNSYFVNQIYAFEGGGIIVKQPDGDPVMRVDPPITVKNNIDGTIEIYFDIPVIIGVTGKNSTNGHGSCFIRTNFSNKDPPGLPTEVLVPKMDIFTNYPNAWKESLHDLLGDNFVCEIKNDTQPNHVEVIPNKTTTLFYHEIYIYAQISPGWIE